MITGIVLAGGKGRRMGGVEKALLKIGQKTVLERLLESIHQLFQEIIVVTNAPHLYQNIEAKVVTDLLKEKGSLGGLYTGLSYARSSYAFCLAADMPFLNPQLLSHMIGQIHRSYDAVVPLSLSGPEPLHAIYASRLIGKIQGQLQEDRLKIVDFLKEIRVKYLEYEELRPFDPYGFSFFNINSPGDLEEARDIEARRGFLIDAP